MRTLGYAAHSAGPRLAPYTFERRALRPEDDAIEILHCGVCHTDLHMARDDVRYRFVIDMSSLKA